MNAPKNSFITTQSQIIYVGLNEELVTLFKRALEIVRRDNIVLLQHLSGIVMHMIGMVFLTSTLLKVKFRNCLINSYI